MPTRGGCRSQRWQGLDAWSGAGSFCPVDPVRLVSGDRHLSERISRGPGPPERRWLAALALANAASIAALLLTTETLVVDKPEDAEADAHQH